MVRRQKSLFYCGNWDSAGPVSQLSLTIQLIGVRKENATHIEDHLLVKGTHLPSAYYRRLAWRFNFYLCAGRKHDCVYDDRHGH
jgi:hypothetical protein